MGRGMRSVSLVPVRRCVVVLRFASSAAWSRSAALPRLARRPSAAPRAAAAAAACACRCSHTHRQPPLLCLALHTPLRHRLLRILRCRAAAVSDRRGLVEGTATRRRGRPPHHSFFLCRGLLLAAEDRGRASSGSGCCLHSSRVILIAVFLFPLSSRFQIPPRSSLFEFRCAKIHFRPPPPHLPLRLTVLRFQRCCSFIAR